MTVTGADNCANKTWTTCCT